MKIHILVLHLVAKCDMSPIIMAACPTRMHTRIFLCENIINVCDFGELPQMLVVYVTNTQSVDYSSLTAGKF